MRSLSSIKAQNSRRGVGAKLDPANGSPDACRIVHESMRRHTAEILASLQGPVRPDVEPA